MHMANEKQQADNSTLPEALLKMAEEVSIDAGQCLTEQYHIAEHLYYLLSGEVSFYIRLGSQEDKLTIGTSNQAGTVIGWSGLRSPNRYATTVCTDTACTLLRLPQAEVMQYFQTQPEQAQDLLENILITGSNLLQQVRDMLAANVKQPISKLTYILPRYKTRFKLESEVVQSLLQQATFLAGFSRESQDILLENIELQSCYSGETVIQAGEPVDALYLLVNGAVNLYYEPQDRHQGVVFLRSLTSQGQALNVQSVHQHTVNHLSVIANQDSLFCCLPFAALCEAADRHPDFGLELQYALLSLLGNQLRSSRAQLVNQIYDDEVFNIRGILEQAAPQLSVSSVLHKVPHLLENRVTHGDVFRSLEQAQLNGSALEKNLAGLCIDVLQETRSEWQFYQGLQHVYQSVVEAPVETSADDIRKRNTQGFQDSFNKVRYVIKGEENLPEQAGHIFILNHLVSHPYHVLPNHFELSLDTNFVSAMILDKQYADSGIRVVRKGRRDEYAHHNYYSRLDYIQVMTEESDSDSEAHGRSQTQRFLDEARACLQQNMNIVICPEGRSLWSDESPGLFKPGAFLLAASMQPEPYIVPVAMANFDRRLHHTRLAAVIKPAFRISDKVDVNNKQALKTFLEDYQATYRGYVEEAQQLARTA